MTPKQARFVQEYLKDLNATQAAIRAGYSSHTADQIGHQLLKKTSVAEAVTKGKTILAEKAMVSAERIVNELAKLGFSNMDDFIRRTPDGDFYTDFSEVNRDQMAAVGEVTVETYKEGRGDDAKDVKRVKFKLSDKRAALVDLGRHLGMFNDRVTITDERMVVRAPDKPADADEWAGKHGPH